MSASASKSVLRLSAASKRSKGILAVPQDWIANFSTTSTPCQDGKRDYETRRRPTLTGKEAPNLTSLKRGPGYRSSFSGTVATVFGATGMVGRGVCNRFGKSGTQLIIPYRGDHYHNLRLKVVGDLGQVLFSPYKLYDEDSIRKAMKYSDIVVNLIGRDYRTRNFTFHDVNVKGPALLAKVAREMGVKRFVHISSINAKEHPDRLFMPKGSEWLRTKWLGEKAVLDEFPDATIFRPSHMYGEGDTFVNYWNGFWRSGLQLCHIPLWKRGVDSIRSPLYVHDLTSAIMASLDDPATKGVTFEAMGPERFLLSDLVDWMFEQMYKTYRDWSYQRTDLRLEPTCVLKSAIWSLMPSGHKRYMGCTLEQLERYQLTEVSEGLPNITELGVKLLRVEDRMPYELITKRINQNTFDHDPPVIHPLVPLSRFDERRILEGQSHAKWFLASIGMATK